MGSHSKFIFLHKSIAPIFIVIACYKVLSETQTITALFA